MVSVLTRLSDSDGPVIYGVDTETYNDDGHYGLKSIQIWGHKDAHYLTTDNFEQEDEEIRSDICSKLFTWLESQLTDVILAFFNLDFDFSQIAKNLVQNSPWEYVDKIDRGKLKKGTFAILESDSNIYKCQIKTNFGINIVMIDIANFLTSTTLDKACYEWIGQRKVELDSKKFPKSPASEIERYYAMKDAELTCCLFDKLQEESVTESTAYVTIAGRTMGHFRDFLRSRYSLTFEEFCYSTKDKSLVKEYNLEWEKYLRESNRGGCCMALHKGYFPNCRHADAVSMYPSQMVGDYIPTGSPLLVKPTEGHYATIHFPSCILTLKPGKIPYLQWNSNAQCIQYAYTTIYKAGEYCNDALLDGSHAFWDDEWQIIQECYDIQDLSDNPIYIKMKRNVALKDYILMLFEGKRTNTGTKRYFYKILMNALYGKFLSRPDGKRISYANGERHTVLEDDKKLYYLPLGSWIAMMGRVTLFKCLLSLDPDDVLYCDTDSCIYKGDKDPDIKIGKDLGCWEIENTHFDAWIVGPKTYQELSFKPMSTIPYNPLITKCAGVNADVKATIPFRDLAEGKTYMVKRAKRDKETWAKNIVNVPYEINTRAGVLH